MKTANLMNDIKVVGLQFIALCDVKMLYWCADLIWLDCAVPTILHKPGWTAVDCQDSLHCAPVSLIFWFRCIALLFISWWSMIKLSYNFLQHSHFWMFLHTFLPACKPIVKLFSLQGMSLLPLSLLNRKFESRFRRFVNLWTYSETKVFERSN